MILFKVSCYYRQNLNAVLTVCYMQIILAVRRSEIVVPLFNYFIVTPIAADFSRAPYFG